MNGVAQDVADPETGLPVWKRLQLRRIERDSKEERQEARTRPDLRLGALGSGSDYTVFIDHLGVASLNLGYGGEDGGGIYHSIYDDDYWYTHFSDTDFRYGRALAQTIGMAVMRLADAEVLPHDFTDLSDTVHRYATEVKKLLEDKQEEVRERNKEIGEGVFTATMDPHEKTVPPPAEPVPPFLSFAPLENGQAALATAAERYDKAFARAQSNGGAALARAGSVNAILIESERRLTDSKGLPRRPWFIHMIYAPGFYTGYSVKTLPGVREAIEEKKWDEANAEIVRVARVLTDEAALIDRAAAALEQAAQQ